MKSEIDLKNFICLLETLAYDEKASVSAFHEFDESMRTNPKTAFAFLLHNLSEDDANMSEIVVGVIIGAAIMKNSSGPGMNELVAHMRELMDKKKKADAQKQTQTPQVKPPILH